MNKATLNKKHFVVLSITWESFHHTEVLTHLAETIDDARKHFVGVLTTAHHSEEAIKFVESADIKPVSTSNFVIEEDNCTKVYALTTETIYNF